MSNMKNKRTCLQELLLLHTLPVTRYFEGALQLSRKKRGGKAGRGGEEKKEEDDKEDEDEETAVHVE